MAGHLELVETPDGGFRILVLDGGDALMGLSKRFSSLDDAVEGVAAMREVAGTGLLRTGSTERYEVLMQEASDHEPAPMGLSVATGPKADTCGS
jgi:hypothetical protein